MTDDKSKMTIQELELAIVSKDFAEAERILIYLATIYVLNKVELTIAPYDRSLSTEQKKLESYQVIEKLATLVTIWFSDWSYTPSSDTFSFICLQKTFLNNLFSASSYHSTDHILANLGLVNKTDYTPEQLRRLLFVITVETAVDVPWIPLFQHLPDITVLAYTGQLRSINIQMSNRAKRNISHLVDAAKVAPIVNTKDVENLSPLITSFFNCSNLNEKNKYFVKQWVVKVLKKHMAENLPKKLKSRIKNEVKIKANKVKPKMVIIHEHYFEKHAMYRCWHSSFKPCMQFFDVTAIGLTSDLDEVAKKDFHHVVTIDDRRDIVGFVEAILDVKPDVILFASVGMSLFSPLLATQRLAPIQIVCGGHPSSTYIDTIDYMLWEDFVPKSTMKKILSEKFLPYQSRFTPTPMLPYTLITQPDDDKIKIMINGVVQKITKDLVDVCNRLIDKTDKKLEFHLFMAHPKQDMDYFSTMSILRRFMPSCIVHPFTNYNDYMNVVGNCDFALPTIPFGGSNSNMDLIRLKIPKLFLKDETDLCSLTDYQIWNSVGVLDGYCTSLPELEKRALEWISNPNLLMSIKEKLGSQEVANLMQSCEALDEADLRVVEAIKTTLN